MQQSYEFYSKVVIHRGFTYGDRLIATYHQPINLSPSFPLINTLKKQVYFFYPPFIVHI